MKKLFVLILVLFALTLSYSANIAGDGDIQTPGNARVVKLGTCNSGVYDTIKTTLANTYGPYNLSFSKTRPQIISAKLFAAKGALSAGDSLQFAYQIISGNKITDTIVSGWTAVDTVTGVNGEICPLVDLSSAVGNAIVFRLLSLDASTVLIKYPMRVIMKESAAVTVDK